MIQGFRRSRLASGGLLAAAVIIAAAAWLRNSGHPFYVPLIASVLMIGIGYFSSRVLGNVLANMENTRYLGYLHMELDPEKFCRVYQDVPGRMKPGSAAAAICRSYLADGYAAAGDDVKALELLSQQPPEDNLPVRGLYAANRAACLLHLGKAEQARQELQQLEQVIDGCRLNKPELARNLGQSLSLYREYLKFLEGEPVDQDYLKEEFRRAQYHLRRLEIARILALEYQRRADGQALKEQLRYLRKNGGKTVYKRWADQQ